MVSISKLIVSIFRLLAFYNGCLKEVPDKNQISAARVIALMLSASKLAPPTSTPST